MVIENEKFKDMSYEEGIKKLEELISLLEKGEGSFDELMATYKEAFEYYTFCCEYLSEAGAKIKELNDSVIAVANPLEDIK